MSGIHIFGVHTFIEKDGDFTVIRYHNTPVIKFNDKEIHLNSGGWMTATTKRRMNQAGDEFKLGYTVFQRDFEWLVDFKQKVVPFVDGMVLNREE